MKVKIESEERLVQLILADPGSGNALDNEMVSQLTGLIQSWRGRAEILLLRSEGSIFSVGRPKGLSKPNGAHVADSDRQRSDSIQKLRESLLMVVQLNRELRHWPGVTMAGVQGDARGAATGLLVQCDIVLAEERARFSFPEITRDIPPTLVGSYLPMSLNQKAANYLILTGREVSAEMARQWGLISEVVPTGRLDERLSELIAFLKSRKPGALRVCKEALLQSESKLDHEAAEKGIEHLLKWLAEAG